MSFLFFCCPRLTSTMYALFWLPRSVRTAPFEPSGCALASGLTTTRQGPRLCQPIRHPSMRVRRLQARRAAPLAVPRVLSLQSNRQCNSPPPDRFLLHDWIKLELRPLSASTHYLHVS